MNLIQLNAGQPLTMSSREIAVVVEQRHDNVKRTIETLGNKGVITLPQIEEVPNDGPGPKTIGIYRLGKRDSLVVVAQLCPEFTARLVDRWQELEQKEQQPAIPQSYVEALRLAADLAEEKLQLENKVIELAPKAAAHDMLAVSEGDLCVTDAAKALGVPPRKFTSYLIHIGWAYRRQSNGKLVGHATSEKRGLMTHRPVPIHHSSGEIETVLQPLITPKGLAKLAEMLTTGESA